jgi:hypothetical protein
MLANVNHELWCHAISPLESAFYGLTDVRIQEIESDTSNKAGEEEENGNWRWCGNTSLRARHDVDRRKGRIRRKEEKKDERLLGSRRFESPTPGRQRVFSPPIIG